MGDHRGLAVCLAVAATLHVAAVLTVEVPELRARNPLPAIDLVLRPPATTTPNHDAPVAPTGAHGTSPPHPATATSAPQRNPDTPGPSPGTGAPPPASAAPDRPAPETRTEAAPAPRQGVKSPHDLASAITAHARQLAAGTPQDPGETDSRVRLAGPPDGNPELAYYLQSWRRKVERVGSINYPREARARGLSGTLELLVAIEPDGALQDVRVLKSSGHRWLDEGAVRIVHLAAPFSPFTANMRTGIDVLEIEHTWRFRRDRLTP